MNLSENIRRYIDAGFPILYLNSFEERVMDEEIKKAVKDSGDGWKITEWNGIGGFTDFDTKQSFEMQDATLAGTLNFLLSAGELDGNILVIKDAASLLEEMEVVAVLRGIAERICSGEISSTIIIESVIRRIPKELESYITILEVPYLTTEEIRGIIQEFVSEQGTDIKEELLSEMAVAFKGLSKSEIENLLALSYQDDGELTKGDLKLIFEQKSQMVMKAGILEMIPLKESLEDIGGLENLKKWLRKKAVVLKNVDRAVDFGVDIPKGVLIAGIPGCGKSLNAKAAAKLFEVPLLRLDMGRLMGKYIGESEGNMRKAINMAEAIAPCVLWVDELEKAFAGVSGDSGDSGVTTRLFGNFLTWLQEKDSPVFVVATANDISKLPPELLRKGRFDEIFYVGLPNKAEREKIFEIHIGKRRKADLKNIQINKLVDKTDGYSGADIEGVIKESIETVYSEGRNALRTEDILTVIKNTHSLKELLADSLKTMTEVYEKGNFKKASL
ncbi:MAG: AAA family ATPase [Ruminococcus flavefaciens]|nr:AAA family ATPase [Ruminococcus flavefaciens]